jgi:hypothetical protein
VEELQYALELMGIQKSAADVQELMDSVDKDGSGEPPAPALVPVRVWYASYQQLASDCENSKHRRHGMVP